MSGNDVLICGKVPNKGLDERTLELMEAGKKLSRDLGIGLSAVVIGDDLDLTAEELATFGVDRVYKLEHPQFETFQADLWVEALARLCIQIKPKVLLMPHSILYMEIAPRLAYRLGTILTTDCIGLDIDHEDGLLLRTKPVHGGNAIAVFKYEGDPQFVTIREKSMEPAEPVSRKGEIITITPEMGESIAKVESIKTVKEEEVALGKAEVIIAGGRGIGGPEGFRELDDLAESFHKSFEKVAVGCSRPPVDLGWMPSNRQIGLTGEIVSPALYLAVGISGAIQHLGGMMRSRKIVAINSDSNSNIFHVADYGAVGDYKKIVPALRKKWGELS